MTTSLELSKKLAEAGLKIETEKKWSKWYYGILTFGRRAELFEGEYRIIDTPVYLDNTEYLAPSTDELLAVMPDRIEIIRYTFNFYVYIPEFRHREKDIELSEALGKMILWLLSNGWRWNKTQKILVK